MAYNRRKPPAKRRTAAKRPARRTYAAPKRRAPVRAKKRAAPRQQVIRIELVQAPQPVSLNPIADALGRKVTPAPKKSRF